MPHLALESLTVHTKGADAAEVAAAVMAVPTPVQVTVPKADTVGVRIKIQGLLDFDLGREDTVRLQDLIKAEHAVGHGCLLPAKVQLPVDGPLASGDVPAFSGNLSVKVVSTKDALKHFVYCLSGYLRTSEVSVGPFWIVFVLTVSSRILLASAMRVPTHFLTYDVKGAQAGEGTDIGAATGSGSGSGAGSGSGSAVNSLTPSTRAVALDGPHAGLDIGSKAHFPSHSYFEERPLHESQPTATHITERPSQDAAAHTGVHHPPESAAEAADEE